MTPSPPGAPGPDGKVQQNGGTEVDRREANDRRKVRSPFSNEAARLQFVARAIGFGTYDLDCRAGISLWSDELREIAGLPPSDRPLTLAQLESLIYLEDRQRVLSRLQGSFSPSGEGEFEEMHRLVRPDGALRWVRARGRTFFSGEGQERKPWVATGAMTDITDQVSAEEALRRSREDLALAMQGAGIGIWHWSLQTREVRMSDYCRRLFAIPQDGALTLDRVLMSIHPDDRLEAENAIGRALAEGTEYRFEKRFIWPDGSVHWLECIGREMKEEGTGLSAGLRSVCQDVTGRKESELRLQESEARFRATFEQLAVGIAYVSLEGDLLKANAKFKAILGYDDADLAGLSFREVTHPDDLDKDLENLNRLRAGEIPGYSLEKRYFRRDGGTVWCNLTVSPVRAPAGKMDYLVAVLEDIQARKDAERSLAEEREAHQRLLVRQVDERTAEATESNLALVKTTMELSSFAHVAAHDLQTPLRSIAGFAQLLQQAARHKLGPDERKWLDLIIGGTRRLQELILDLLAYARLDAGARPHEPTDLGKLAEEARDSLDALIRESGAEIHCSPLPHLTVERTQLVQVFQNLFENAIKYRSARPPRIAVTAARRAKEWVIAVTDNGIGIDARHHERIFEVFRRLHTYTEIPGTGIGLATCQRIIEGHGGRIWVESERGKGSAFLFSLPAGD